jgi:hypothetical protein
LIVTLVTVVFALNVGQLVGFAIAPITTASPDAGAPLGLQLPAVAQAVLVAPVQVFVTIGAALIAGADTNKTAIISIANTPIRTYFAFIAKFLL